MKYLPGALLCMVRPWTSIALLFVVALLSSCGSSREAEPTLPAVAIPPDVTLEESPQTSGPVMRYPKLDSALNQLLAAYNEQGIDGAQAVAETRGMVLEGQSVEVTIITTPAEVDRLTQAIVCLGGVVQGDYQERVEALVPLDRLASVAELPEVQQIREPQRAVP